MMKKIATLGLVFALLAGPMFADEGAVGMGGGECSHDVGGVGRGQSGS